MFLNTKIYENYSAVLQKQDGSYFFETVLQQKLINLAILLKGLYIQKECQSPLLEIDTLSFLLDFYRNKVFLGNSPLLMLMNSNRYGKIDI